MLVSHYIYLVDKHGDAKPNSDLPEMDDWIRLTELLQHDFLPRRELDRIGEVLKSSEPGTVVKYDDSAEEGFIHMFTKISDTWDIPEEILMVGPNFKNNG